MSNVVTLQTPTPRAYTASQLLLIQNTVAQGTTHDEFNMFVHVCKTMQLDPLRKQLYCIVYNKDNPKKRKVAFVTGIDGFRAIAERSGNYRPDDKPAYFEFDETLKNKETNPAGIVSATVKAFKRDQSGDWFPVVATAYWEEFAPLKESWEYNEAKGKKTPSGKFKLEGNWLKMGRVMLAKCAESQMLRKGWPEDLSGVHSQEEMKVVETEMTATEEIETYQKEERLKHLNSSTGITILWKAGDPLELVPMGQVVDRCIAFIREVESLIELKTWFNTNKDGLKLFWASHKSDYLEIKKIIEEKTNDLESE